METPETRQENIRLSKERIDKLTPLVQGFNYHILNSVLDQITITHEMFVGTQEMQTRDLEQFHYYYTDTLLNLLVPLKKRKDDKAVILKEHIKIVERKIIEAKEYIKVKKTYVQNRRIYANNLMYLFLNLYRILCQDEVRDVYTHNGLKFTQDNLFFHIDNGIDYYMELDDADYEAIQPPADLRTYRQQNIIIQTVLMGKLQKNKFVVEYIEGLIYHDTVFELFKITDVDTYFVFSTSTMTYYIVDYLKIRAKIDAFRTSKDNVSNDLDDSKNKLQMQLANIKFITEPQIKNSLREFLEKIKNINFLGDDIDIEIANAQLENMTNTEMLDI